MSSLQKRLSIVTWTGERERKTETWREIVKTPLSQKDAGGRGSSRRRRPVVPRERQAFRLKTRVRYLLQIPKIFKVPIKSPHTRKTRSPAAFSRALSILNKGASVGDPLSPATLKTQLHIPFILSWRGLETVASTEKAVMSSKYESIDPSLQRRVPLFGERETRSVSL